MEAPGREEAPKGAFGRSLHAMALGAGWVILLLTFYTVLDVVLRYVFNAPFRGSLEFTQFMMSVIVFLGLAHCGWTGGHVAVDILERPLEKPGLRYVPAILTFVSAALFAAIAWYTFNDGLAQINRISNMLRWPFYPFIFIAAFGCAVYAIALFIQSLRPLRHPR